MISLKIVRFFLFSTLATIISCKEKTDLKFVDENNRPLSRYDKIWDFVNKNVGDCPRSIQFGKDTRKDGFSRFNGFPPKVIMAKSPDDKRFPMILAHETSHVCLYKKTKGMSNKNQFRFFDEGLADIIGGRYVGGEANYRAKSFEIAKTLAAKGEITFKKVQNWKSYFGSPPNVNFDAYRVGATFIYFVTDQYGQEKLDAFFISVGKTQNLATSIREVFSIELKILEKNWINYIQSQ